MSSDRSEYEDTSDLPCISEVDAYLESLEHERNDSAHTIRSYKADLLDFLRWAQRSGFDPMQLRYRQLRRYLGELDRAEYARTTINRHLSSLKGFYSWLNVMGITDANPASAMQGPKSSSKLPRALSQSDIDKLLSIHAAVDAIGTHHKQTPTDMRDQAVLELLYACGLRVSEVSNLKYADVDFGQSQVKVFGKGSKERIVPMHETAALAMISYRNKARPQLLNGSENEYFFLSSRGNRFSEQAIRRMFKSALAEAGLDESLSPHAMRHTFATDVLAGGADLRSVQEMLGHSSLSTTQIYTHISPERLADVHHQAHPRG